jgi:uncharacterized protein (TIGR00304 family)
VIDSAVLYALGIALIFAGVLVIAVAFVLFFILGVEKCRVKGGGVVMIGPFPIVFGTDEKLIKTVLLLSLVLAVMLVMAIVTYYLLLR